MNAPKTVEEILDDQYDELSKKFRPVFGNLKHIQIVKETNKLNKLNEDFIEKLENAKNADKIAKEVIKTKRNLVFLLKKVL